MNHKIKETYEFQYQGIKIFVRIDYFNNKIDILEMVDASQSTFKKKDWCFIGRGVEYMQGWRNILEAIKEATKDAERKYLANLAEESKFKDKILLDIGVAKIKEDIKFSKKNEKRIKKNRADI